MFFKTFKVVKFWDKVTWAKNLMPRLEICLILKSGFYVSETWYFLHVILFLHDFLS
jgi:hypothetical protein